MESGGVWGLVVAAGKSYSQTVDVPFRVSGASLGPAPENQERATLMIRVGQSEFALCSLIPGSIEQAPLDLVCQVGEAITFYVNGLNSFHLTGNYIQDDMGQDGEMAYGYDDFSEDDEDEYEDGEDDEDDVEDVDDEEDMDDEEDDEEEDSDEEDEIPEFPAKRPAKKEEFQQKKMKIEPVKKESPKKQEQKKQNEKQVPEKKPAQDKKEPSSPKKQELKKEEAKKEQPKTQQPADAEKKKLPNGLVVQDVKIGSDGKKVKAGRKVGIYYIGKLNNGKVFDKCQSGKPFTFSVGKGEVIKGMDLGVVGMALNGERKLTIPAELAYGKSGAPPSIPPNAQLTFEIKVVSIN